MRSPRNAKSKTTSLLDMLAWRVMAGALVPSIVGLAPRTQQRSPG